MSKYFCFKDKWWCIGLAVGSTERPVVISNLFQDLKKKKSFNTLLLQLRKGEF